MRTILPALSLLLLLGVPLPAQDLHLAVSSSLGGSGTACDPVTCTPARVPAPRGQRLALATRGAPGQLHFLVVALPPAQCSVVPGIAGPLILQPPAQFAALPLTWGRIYVSGPPGANLCGGWMGFGALTLPASLPTGPFLVQLLAPVWLGGSFQWTLSNAVEVTVR